MKILGIETSCDETAAAIVTDGKEILSNEIYSQIDEHQPYGGVVPEIASRSHINNIDRVIKQAIYKAKVRLRDIDAIAVTAGPGLIGGVIVGLMVAKAIASAANKPLIAVNHLEGHALTPRLTGDVDFPFLLLLVSGGHCQILSVEGVGKYTKLGATLDDALGEAFDKTAKMLALGYPGGPVVERLALDGDMNRFKFPKPLAGRAGCDFSFSGLKTAVFREISAYKNLNHSQAEIEIFNKDICASFQKTCGEVLVDRLQNAIHMFKEKYPDANNMVVAGGVAANKYLNGVIENICQDNDMNMSIPPISLCTDNAAMIAWAGIERYKLGLIDEINVEPRARWSLEDLVV